MKRLILAAAAALALSAGASAQIWLFANGGMGGAGRTPPVVVSCGAGVIDLSAGCILPTMLGLVP